jgi:ABC-2 type transport system ATP-binding protein
MSDAVLSVEDLFMAYGTKEAVRGLTFEVERGECFGLLGPNGAGKTTTIAALAGLAKPTRGRVRVDGRDISSHPAEIRSRMGLVPQDLALYQTLTAGDNLSFFGRLYGLRGRLLQQRSTEVLDAVRLGEYMDATVSGFSNGMKRRLNIAIGLLQEPEILILDEPTVGVDAQSRNAVFEALNHLTRSGVTILYTTHYMEEAERLCSRVAIMDHGRIIALDRPASLIRTFAQGVIHAEFEGPIPESLLKRLETVGEPRLVGGRANRLRLETADREEALKRVLEAAAVERLALRGLDILAPNLETVFLHLTGRRVRDAHPSDAG